MHIVKNGIAESSQYPYVQKTRSCQKKILPIFFQPNFMYSQPNSNEDKLKTMLTRYGPLAIGIRKTFDDSWINILTKCCFADAANSLNLYSSGVYYDPNCPNTLSSLNHAVVSKTFIPTFSTLQNINLSQVLVGYGTDPAAGDYWILRNSWGKGWGMGGYFWMARNKGNQCGVAELVSF